MTEVRDGMEVVSSQSWDGEMNERLLWIVFANNFGAASGFQASWCVMAAAAAAAAVAWTFYDDVLNL